MALSLSWSPRGHVWLASLLLWLSGATLLQSASPPTAELKISGYGLLGDLRLKRALQLLEPTGRRPEFFGADFVEDSALILFSRLKRDGYLRPRLVARLTLQDGRQVSYAWDQPLRSEPLPRPLPVRKLHFEIHKGVLFYFEQITIRGLVSIPEDRARAFFVENIALLRLKRTRIYSPDRMDHGLSSLVEALNRQGYESAEAQATETTMDEASGRVDVTINVREGLKSFVRSIREEYYYEGSTQAERIVNLPSQGPFSKFWLQDFQQTLRSTNFHLGYPDTTVEVKQLQRETITNSVQIDLLAQIRSGDQVRLRDVRFTGQKKTKTSVMERRVRLEEGSLLDRVLVERGRYRLSRLGVFDTVGLTYDKVDEHTRDVTYEVKEGKALEVNLLFGWGSYELARGGIEVNQNNIFGRAHHSRLRLTQSLKSSYGEYVYTMPELIGEDVDVFLNGSALRREEISFTREEYGGGIGLRTYVRPLQSDVSIRYNYEVLNATAPDLPIQAGLPTAGVGSVLTQIRHDRVDNPLYPRRGYRLFGNFDVASEYLASDVNFQRLELGGSYHWPLGGGRWLHFGLSHGAVLTVGSPAEDLPFNRRFFPGGENSIRGYQQGEAAPRDANGQVIGAETYLSGSVQFEQALTPSWALVAFMDTVSFAQHIQDYPFNESLFSVGGGINWKTVVGPIRLEYGYNLNRRAHDPIGTLQFSIGFPF